MIDFRYHIVSIVSIFLALAVGIVLGAGPLQDQLGNTLTNQVSDLRKQKSELAAELRDANQTIDDTNAFIKAHDPAARDRPADRPLGHRGPAARLRRQRRPRGSPSC